VMEAIMDTAALAAATRCRLICQSPSISRRCYPNGSSLVWPRQYSGLTRTSTGATATTVLVLDARVGNLPLHEYDPAVMADPMVASPQGYEVAD
jgi:hypothetical protein